MKKFAVLAILASVLAITISCSSVSSTTTTKETIYSTSGTILPSRNIEPESIESHTGIIDTSERQFYLYDAEIFNIEYDSGAIYLKSSLYDLSDYGEVFIEYEDESNSTCYLTDSNSYQIKCEYYQMSLKNIYLEKTDELTNPPAMTVRQEAAINRNAYLVYDMSSVDLHDSVGMIQFTYTHTYMMGAILISDQNGTDTYECIDGFYSYDSINCKNVYLFITYELASSDLFAIELNYVINVYEQN